VTGRKVQGGGEKKSNRESLLQGEARHGGKLDTRISGLGLVSIVFKGERGRVKKRTTGTGTRSKDKKQKFSTPPREGSQLLHGVKNGTSWVLRDEDSTERNKRKEECGATQRRRRQVKPLCCMSVKLPGGERTGEEIVDPVALRPLRSEKKRRRTEREKQEDGLISTRQRWSR